MTSYSARHPRRLTALILAIAMILSVFTVPAYAQGDWDRLSVRLSWTDAAGTPYEAYAVPVAWSQDQSYWVQVSADAPLAALTMNVSHPDHAYTFDPADGSMLMNVIDAGATLDTTRVIPITAYENGVPVTVFNLYVSTQIAMPEEPAKPPVTADVTINYVANDGAFSETETRTFTEGGDMTVYAREYAGYTVDGEGVAYADVYNPQSITFTYTKDYVPPVTADVTINYVANDGAFSETETRTFTEGGDMTVYAREYAGYTVDGEGVAYADVYNPQSITFTYTKDYVPPVTADVTINYVANDGAFSETETRTFTEGGDMTVYAREYAGYTVDGEGVAYVDVYNPQSITFTYTKDYVPPVTADVTINYVANDGAFSETETRTFTEGGDMTVYAREYAGYTVDGEGIAYVDVYNPQSITFTYTKDYVPPVTADVTINYVANDGAFSETETRTFTEGGDMTVYAREYTGYTVDGEGVAYVDVYNPQSITFTYTKDYVPPVTADVTINYVANDGAFSETETRTFTEGGDMTVYAREYAGYTVDGEGVAYVDVYNPQSITFTYTANQTAPVTADVTINYVANDGAFSETETRTFTEGGDMTVYAREYAGYTVDGEGVAYVDVYNPQSITFTYTAIQTAPVTADVTINYVANDGAFSETETRTFTEGGDMTVYAREYTGYTVDGEGVAYVDVYNPQSITFTYTKDYVPPVTADVTINYVANDGAFSETETRTFTEGGDMTVYAREYAGYTVDGEGIAYVDVYNPQSITFTYTANPVEVIPAAAQVTIQYIATDGSFSDSETVTMVENSDDNVAIAREYPGYTVDNESAVYVTVYADGTAAPNPVIFYYTANEPEQPEEPEVPVQPAPDAVVTINYVDVGDNTVFAQDTQTCPANQVTAIMPRADLTAGYEAIEAAPVNVTVDASGVADRAEVTFTFKWIEPEPEVPVEPEKPAEPQPAVVSVYYRNEAGENIAEPVQVTLPGGVITAVAPDRSLVPDGYDPNSAQPVPVDVTVEGVATPAEVVFTFAETIPEDIPVPQGEMINRLGRINEAQVAMRTEPSAAGKNTTVVKRLKEGTYVYMLREEINDKGEAWVRVLEDGKQYFVSGKFVDMLTKYESDKLMKELYGEVIPPMSAEDIDGPSAPEQPEEPEQPDLPEQYAGYALTSKPVAMRSQLAGGDETIVRLMAEKELVLVTGQEFVQGTGEAWSRATTLDNEAGYIPDNSLTRISNDEAQAYIRQWEEANKPAVPEQYAGYALTTRTVALRTEINPGDEAIIRTLQAKELVMVSRQEFEEGSGAAWSVVTTLDDTPGYLPDDSLRRINNEEAQYYLKQWEEANKPAEPDEPEKPSSPSEPPPVRTGYAVTIGDDVFFRTQPTTLSSIIDVLPRNVVVYVKAQEYVDEVAWHIVQYKDNWGYIRADMLRMMTVEEENAYLENQGKPDVPSGGGPDEYDPNSRSSYGYVSASSVNFRKEASTSSSRIAQLKKYAFCLVLGTAEVNGETWYHVSYNGKTGYILGKYFSQLSIAELEEFLDSDEYRQGIANNTAGNTENNTQGSGGLVSPEDNTVNKWTDPNGGLNVSYEPFDPFATVEPIPTESALPTETVTAEPTATLEPMPTVDVTYPDDSNGGNGIVGWIIAIVVIALIGGGVYAYVLYNQNRRRAAQRAAQRRAQAAAQQRGARPTGQPRTGTYPNQQGSAQRPNTPAPGQPRRPYVPGVPGTTAQNPYSRPAQPGQPQGYQQPANRPAQPGQPQQGANNRPQAAPYTRPDGAPVQGRRSAYRATQNGQQPQNPGANGNPAYRSQPAPTRPAGHTAETNGDFDGDQDNGDF